MDHYAREGRVLPLGHSQHKPSRHSQIQDTQYFSDRIHFDIHIYIWKGTPAETLREDASYPFYLQLILQTTLTLVVISPLLPPHQVYNVTEFLQDHPGGPEIFFKHGGKLRTLLWPHVFLILYSCFQRFALGSALESRIVLLNLPSFCSFCCTHSSGKEATSEFEEVFHSIGAREQAADFCIGKLKGWEGSDTAIIDAAQSSGGNLSVFPKCTLFLPILVGIFC